VGPCFPSKFNLRRRQIYFSYFRADAVAGLTRVTLTDTQFALCPNLPTLSVYAYPTMASEKATTMLRNDVHGLVTAVVDDSYMASTRNVPARKLARTTFLVFGSTMLAAHAQQPNPYTQLMETAASHAKAHHDAAIPAFSPSDTTVLDGTVAVTALQKRGIKVVPWTTNDPEKMRAVIRTGVDGLISDRPDLLQKVIAEERASSPDMAAKLRDFNVSGHRGGRGLRPENTLPAFESGLDNLIDTIETDTGVTTDRVSMIWHDQFFNPQSCRKTDGSPYTMENRIYLRDISSHDAQATLICDKLKNGPTQFPDQRNDLILSPVAVAFAAQEHLINPYVPTYAEQLFRFTAFYTEYYRTGAGKSNPRAVERAKAGERVHFNLETKILPDYVPPGDSENQKNHTASPQEFVDTLCGAITRNHMEARSDVQSFDFRTLVLVEEQFPAIQTFYLTEGSKEFATEFVPAALRQEPAK
jgi:glycerophosphoryl diester phosphodiesterase